MSEAVEFCTDHLAPKERFDAWRQMTIRMAGLSIERDAEDRTAGFNAAGRFQSSGPLARFEVQSDAVRTYRGRNEISRHPSGCYCIYRELSDGAIAHSDHAGREVTTRRGSLFIRDLDQPFLVQPVTGARYRHKTLIVPKPLLDPHLPRRPGAIARLLADRPGLDGLAASALEALWREWDGIPESAMTRAADTICRLIGLAIGAADGDHAEVVRYGRLTQAKRYIDRRLADPGLSAARAAAAMQISERALYALFGASGTTFAAHVRRRRLEECRAALLANPSRPVMDIALSWGFGSMPSFYRAFQAAFGVSPGDLREAAVAAAAPSKCGK